MRIYDVDPYLLDEAPTSIRVCHCDRPRPNLDLEDERHPELRCHKCGGDLLRRYSAPTRKFVLGVIREEARESYRRRNG